MDLYVWIAEAINESSQTDQETSTCRGSITIHREFGLKDYERNLLSTLPNSVLDEIVENFDVQDVNNDEEDFLPDLNPRQAQFHHLLIDDWFKLGTFLKICRYMMTKNGQNIQCAICTQIS